jgi:hypothetical protein
MLFKQAVIDNGAAFVAIILIVKLSLYHFAVEVGVLG